MDDLETTVVITPAIPFDDMTPLERLVLSHVFDADVTHDGLQLFSDRGAANVLQFSTTEVATAYAASSAMSDSDLNRIVARYWTDADGAGETVEIPMFGMSWESVLMNIVARSSILTEIRVLEWYRHPSQRPDSFGANVILITANAVVGIDSDDLLEQMRAETETRWSAETFRRSTGVPDPAGANPAVDRMRQVIDPRRDARLPRENSALVSREQDSRAGFIRFIESFGAPVPVVASADERWQETVLFCWEAMKHFQSCLMNDRPIVPSVYAMLEVWAVVGSLQMRRWAMPVADLALRIHDHLGEQLINPPSPFDLDFVPAVIEVLSWTQNGPELPGSIEETAVKVLAKLVDYREKRR